MYRIFYTILLSFSLLETLWAHKTVCYWDASSKYREEKFGVKKLRESLWQCNNLIVGFLELNDETFQISDPNNRQIKTLRKVVNSRKDGMKIFLGIGPSVYHKWNMDTYNHLLEHEELRNKLVETVTRVAVELSMDGIDLSWPFLPSPDFEDVKEPITQGLESMCCQLFAKLRRTSHEELEVPACLGEKCPKGEIRDAFTDLIKYLAASLKNVRKDLSLTVLPRTSVDYYDVPKILPNLKTIHLLTFDYVTPLIQPKLADYTAPLYDSNPSTNRSVDATIRSWKNAGTPGNKIVMGIPTFGRSWKVSDSLGHRQVHNPPLSAEMPDEGTRIAFGRIPGLRLYDTVCRHREYPDFANPIDKLLTNTVNYYVDTERYRGSYQYGRKKAHARTTWSTYEDKQIIVAKVKYMKEQGLAGVAIYDLSFDDTSNECKDGSVLSIARTSLVSSSR